MKIAIVAGETSGDLLAADLIRALQAHIPDLEIEGVTGPAMRELGVNSLADMQELAVMGIAEVLADLPRLLKLRKRLTQHWLENPPDVFIGVDAPDFNLGIERKLKQAGVRTVHYVSPTVWAWRPGRVHKIAAAADLLLCLFPFEPDCYSQVALEAVYVGHPFAQQIKTVPNQAECRRLLDLPEHEHLLAVLPGSRGGEVAQLAPIMVKAIARLRRRMPGLRFVIPIAHEKLRPLIESELQYLDGHDDVYLVSGHMREVVRAADVALVTSGTATLETMLLGTPFVVAYRAAAFTAWLLRGIGMLKIQHVALPNILAGEEVARELLQDEATAEEMTTSVAQLLMKPHRKALQQTVFEPLAEQLDQPSGEIAAAAIIKMLGS